MTIHWSLFAPAVLLLLYPADRLLSSAVQLRSCDDFQNLDRGARHRPWWWLPLLWIDPFRGFLGAWLLRRALALETNDWSQIARSPYGLLLAIVGLAVLCQTFTRREEHVLLAPVGFVAGVVTALLPWPVAAIGLAMGATGLFGFREFHAFFAVALAAVGVIGFALDAPACWLIPAVGLLGLPVAAGLLTGSTLEFPTRDTTGPRQPVEPPAR